MTTPKYPEIKVTLTGTDGNAFAILGKVQKALKQAGIDPTEFQTQATSGDYDNLLQTCMKWITVE